MDCVASCTALSYEMKLIFDQFHGRYETEVVDDVIHVAYHDENNQAELYFFSYGTFVAWNISEKELQKVAVDIKPYENDPLDLAEYDEYYYEYGEKSLLDNDRIVLPNKDRNAKLAFSHGLAQSAKLGAFETITQKTFADNKHLPESLARYGKIPLSRLQIRKKIGQLFLERSSINLHLDVLDVPDFFWEHPQYEPLYEKLSSELDLSSRAATLNQQLGVLHDLFEVLSNELNDQHSSRLEWAIIILIVFEVLILIFHDVLKVI